MKQSVKMIIGAFILTVFIAGCTTTANGEIFPPPLTGQPTMAPSTNPIMRTVQVSGMAEIQVEPDTALVTLGVQTEGKTAQAALNENNASMQALIDALKTAEVPADNIQTQTIQLTPRYDVNNNNTVLDGYTASNTVQVRTQDLATLGTLLDQAVEAGANTIENISFEVNSSQKLLDQIRETAFQNAQHKADQLASLAGATLGQVLEIQESSSIPSPIARQVEAPVEAVAVPISPGTQSVSIQVQVTWELVVNDSQ